MASQTMNYWALSHDSCRNCTATRFRHAGRGYCARCYRLVRKLEDVKRWQFSDYTTWKELPPSAPSLLHDEATFEKVRRGYIKQINDRLALLGIWEQQRGGQVDPLELEHELRSVAYEAGARNGWYLHSHYANWLAHTFSPEQRQELYKLLNDIRQAKPCGGVDWGKIFHDD